jgi:hypothetical protein
MAEVQRSEAAPRDTRSQRLYDESRLIGAAVTALRAHQPAQALEQVSVYRRKYPRGSMEGEAALAEVQAELDLGLDAIALQQLEDLGRDDFRGVPRPDESRLLRAELLARKTKCGPAVDDFDRLLGSSLEASLEQRALFGRAVCRSKLGNADGARADFSRYLARFPDGRFSGQARRSLAGLR